MSAESNIITCHRCKQRSGTTCTVSGKPFDEHVQLHTCPKARFQVRGAGDVLEKLIHWSGIDKLVKGDDDDCTPCQKRRDAINAMFSREGAD